MTDDRQVAIHLLTELLTKAQLFYLPSTASHHEATAWLYNVLSQLLPALDQSWVPAALDSVFTGTYEDHLSTCNMLGVKAQLGWLGTPDQTADSD